MTSPNPDWALIIHADSADTRVDVYWVDIRAGRLGLALAREVKAWRKRDDLLTLGQRFRVVEPVNPIDDNYGDQQHEADEALAGDDPPLRSSGWADDDPSGVIPPSDPPLVPVVPQDDARRVSRHEYVRGRVAAVMAHSETAKKSLAREWPAGVPGLKHTSHSMDQLDAIQAAVEKVETNQSVPFYPPWDDPELARSIAEHPSSQWIDRWRNPGGVTDSPSSPESVQARLAIQEQIMHHPRQRLLSRWIGEAISGGLNSNVDTTALAHALYEFASVPELEWPDDDLTIMLDGCLRTMGYTNGVRDLGNFDPLNGPLLMSCAFAVAAGNATLLYGENGEASVIIDVIGKSL